jgi:hypothetical protein
MRSRDDDGDDESGDGRCDYPRHEASLRLCTWYDEIGAASVQQSCRFVPCRFPE